MLFKTILIFILILLTTSIKALAQVKEPNDTINKIDNKGKQGYWEIFDNKKRIKEIGSYKDNEQIGEWMFYKYKKDDYKYIYYYDFKSTKKKLNNIKVFNKYGLLYEFIYENGKRKRKVHIINQSW